jgi:juvenile hormone acid methyltransferase
MLKNGGEMLINFLLINPYDEVYKSLDAEWQIYVKVSIYFIAYFFSDLF